MPETPPPMKRTREDQLKQIYGNEPSPDIAAEQEQERKEGLRFRAGQREEQHAGRGKVPVAPGTATQPKLNSKYVKVDRYNLTFPVRTRVATKSYGDVQRGDLLVEGYVSMPVKDLQGDVIELPALVQAKNACIKAPNNLAWLDHESPYTNPANATKPPIGKFVDAKIVWIKKIPALWVKMLVNKMHPDFAQISYELQKGFYNAFSMEFVPLKEGMKMIGDKLANAISDIKYFATSLVRAPACEGSTITKVYTKAFANSSQFYPIMVHGPGWVGQSIRTKGVEKMERNVRYKEAEPEEEPELEPELEPEDEPEGKLEGAPEGFQAQQQPLDRKDYDRETGSTAPERASTAIGEWGDPALEKARAVQKDHEARLRKLTAFAQRADQRRRMSEKLLKEVARQTALIGKALDIKGIDESGIMEMLPEEEAAGSSGLEEQEPPEVAYGKLKPRTQRMVESGAEASDEGIQSVESAQVKGVRFIERIVRKAVNDALERKIVVRKGFAEQSTAVVSDTIRRAKAMEEDDGSIESQLAVTG